MLFLTGWLGQYYGIDILAMIFGVASIYTLSLKTRSGFIFGICSQLAWMVVNSWANVWAGVVLNIILIVLNFRGYLLWRKENKKK